MEVEGVVSSFLDVPADVRHAIFRALPLYISMRCSLVNKFLQDEAPASIFVLDADAMFPPALNLAELARLLDGLLPRLDRLKTIKATTTSNYVIDKLTCLTSLTSLHVSMDFATSPGTVPYLSTLKSLIWEALDFPVFPATHNLTGLRQLEIGFRGKTRLCTTLATESLAPFKLLKNVVINGTITIESIGHFCSLPSLETVDIDDVGEAEPFFAKIAEKAPKRPRFITCGQTFYAASNIEYNFHELVQSMTSHPSATTDINALSPSNNLPALHQTIISARGAHRKVMYTNIKVLLDNGADPNLLVPISCIPSLRSLAKLDPNGAWRVPAIVLALVSGVFDTEILERLWAATPNPETWLMPPVLAALLGSHSISEPFEFISKKIEEVDIMQKFTLVSPVSDIKWIETNPVIEALRGAHFKLLEQVLALVTAEALELHRDTLARILSVQTSDGSTMLHKIVTRTAAATFDSPPHHLLYRVIAVLDDLYVEDNAGRYPLDYWLELGKVFSRHWRLSPELYLKIRRASPTDPFYLKHKGIAHILAADLDSSDAKRLFFRDIWKYVESQEGEEGITKLLENLIIDTDPRLTRHAYFGFPEKPLQSIWKSSVGLRKFLEPITLKQRQLERICSHMLQHDAPHSSSLWVDTWLMFAVCGVPATKHENYLHYILSRYLVSGDDLLSFLELGCSPSHPELLQLLVKNRAFSLAQIICSYGAKRSDMRLIDIPLPRLELEYRPYKNLLTSLIRNGADPNVRNDSKASVVEMLFDDGIKNLNRSKLCFETIAALLQVGAVFRDYIELASTAFSCCTNAIDLNTLIDRIPEKSVDTFKFWEKIIVDRSEYSASDLEYICDALGERGVLIPETVVSRFVYANATFPHTILPSVILRAASSKKCLEQPEGFARLSLVAAGLIQKLEGLRKQFSDYALFFKALSSLKVTKDNVPKVRFVEDSAFQKRLQQSSFSVSSVAELVAFDILSQESIDFYRQNLQPIDLDEEIRIAKASKSVTNDSLSPFSKTASASTFGTASTHFPSPFPGASAFSSDKPSSPLAASPFTAALSGGAFGSPEANKTRSSDSQSVSPFAPASSSSASAAPGSSSLDFGIDKIDAAPVVSPFSSPFTLSATAPNSPFGSSSFESPPASPFSSSNSDATSLPFGAPSTSTASSVIFALGEVPANAGSRRTAPTKKSAWRK